MRFAIFISILGTISIISSFNYSCAFDINFKQSQIQSIYSYYPLNTRNIHKVYKFYPISRESQDFNSENSTISQNFDEIPEGGSMFQFEIFPESPDEDENIQETDSDLEQEPDESTSAGSGDGSGLTVPFCLAKLKGLKKKKLKLLKKLKKLKKVLLILKLLPILFPLAAPVFLLPLLALVLLFPVPVIVTEGRKSPNNLQNMSDLLFKRDYNHIIDKLDQSKRQFSAN